MIMLCSNFFRIYGQINKHAVDQTDFAIEILIYFVNTYIIVFDFVNYHAIITYQISIMKLHLSILIFLGFEFKRYLAYTTIPIRPAPPPHSSEIDNMILSVFVTFLNLFFL